MMVLERRTKSRNLSTPCPENAVSGACFDWNHFVFSNCHILNFHFVYPTFSPSKAILDQT